MHFHCEIVLPPETTDIDSAIQSVMAQFDENQPDDEDHDTRHSFWDFYVIGGRWAGTKLVAQYDQAKLEERIQKVESILQSFQVVSGGGGDTVEIGSKVVVLKEGEDAEKTFVIVGSEEADMSQGKISNRSPFGEALFGKKNGDSIIFKTPNGSAKYKIVKVY